MATIFFKYPPIWLMLISVFYVNCIFNRIEELVDYFKIVIAYLLLFQTANLYGQTYQSVYKEGLAAYEVGEHTVFLEKIQYANELRPDHQTIMYKLAIALVLDGQLDSSCYYLSKVIEIDAINYDLSDKELQKLKGLDAFDEIKERQVFLKTPYLLADTAQLINDASVHIEDVAFDSNKRMFVVSSINKRNLFWLERTGALMPVLKSPLPVSPTGMAVDSQANIWVASMGVVEGGLATVDVQLNKAFLYKIDLTTSSILKTYQVKDEKPHLFGDVFISEEGKVYVSDSKQNEIYVVKNETLEPLLNTEKLLSLQGITQVGNHLILADYVKGLFSYDLVSGELEQINNLPSLSLKGIDGLYRHEACLIAVQNGVQPNRVIKITLNDALSKVLKYEYLEKAHPAFGEPTLGYIDNHQFYFVANSFWTKNNEGIINEASTELPVILSLELAK